MSLSNVQAIKYANEILPTFVNEMVSEYGDDQTMTLADLKSRIVDPEFYVTVGNAVYDSRLSIRRLEDSMERVAINLKGANKVPTSYQILSGISQELDSWDFSIANDVFLDIGKDVYEGTKEVAGVAKNVASGVGDSVTSIAKNLKYYIPIILVLVTFLGFKYVVPDRD